MIGDALRKNRLYRQTPLTWAVLLYTSLTTTIVACYLLAVCVSSRFLTAPAPAFGVFAAASGFVVSLFTRALRRGGHRPQPISAALAVAPLVLLSVVFVPHLSGNGWLILGARNPTGTPTAVFLAKLLILLTPGLAATGALVLAGGPLRRPPARPVGMAIAFLAVLQISAAAAGAGGLQLFGRVTALEDLIPAPANPYPRIEVAPPAPFAWQQLESLVASAYETAAYTLGPEHRLTIGLPLSDRPIAVDLYASLAGENPWGGVFASSCAREARVPVDLQIRRKSGGDDLQARADLSPGQESRLRLVLEEPADFEDTARLEIDPVPGCRVRVYRAGATPLRELPRRVVLISLDTHALDHMTLVAPGMGIDTSPSLRALLAEPNTVAFTNAIAAANWTLPSHATMWTGLYPSQHGLFVSEPVVGLHRRIRTLPEMLKSHDVKTFLLASHVRLEPAYGYSRGIDYFRLYDQPLGRRGAQVLDDGIRLLAENRDDDLFMLLHLFDAHLPYENFPDEVRSLSKRIEPDYPREIYESTLYTESIYRQGGFRPEARRRNVDLYGQRFASRLDAARVAYQLGIRHVDDLLGAFFERLRRAGLYEETTILLVSDHGEEFFDHGLLTHTSLYLENLRVPFLIKLAGSSPHLHLLRGAPDIKPHSFEAHTSAFRVILDLFDAPTPEYLGRARTGGLGLEDLLKLATDRSAFSELHMLPMAPFYEASLITPERLHIILSDDGTGNDVPVFQLYAFDQDSKERRDLYRATDLRSRELATALLNRVTETRQLTFQPQPARDLSEQELAALRALGYL